MKSDELKEMVRGLVILAGKSEARRLLVVAGISPYTANSLTRGVYASGIGPLVGRAIREAVEAFKAQAS